MIQHLIKQHIEKGFAMFVNDFKYDDLDVPYEAGILKAVEKKEIKSLLKRK